MTKATSANGCHRILCYGDSLTAGLVTDNNNGAAAVYAPYAPHLEKALLHEQQQPSVIVARVRQRGIPGWTAAAMCQDLDGPNTGLRSALQAFSAMPFPTTTTTGDDDDKSNTANAGVSLVIILAGTNDIGYGSSAHDICQTIITLHRVCLESGVARTLALAIPPSAYQSINAQAASLVQAINQELQDYCRQHPDQTTYMLFPFEYSRDDGNWCADGLHFSARGYQTLGESLAPIVSSILQQLSAVKQQ
jgi:lysophospholipase L1-like esterase